MRLGTWLPWVMRALWAGLALLAGPALASALAERSRPVELVAAVLAWGLWAVGLVAALVPTTVSLTVLRLLAPTAVAAAVAAGLAGASASATAAALAGTGAAALVAARAEIGQHFVQGSAYGDEQRFPLRPPGPVVVALPVLAALVVVGALAGPLLLAARAWVAGAVTLAVGFPLAVVVARRLHELSRRWLVVVPAGVVVHDPVGLTDNLLLPRALLARIALAPVGTGAADLTLGAPGLALEITSHELVTVVLAADRRHPQGRALHAQAVLVAPSRPGAVLAACAGRRLPVVSGAPR